MMRRLPKRLLSRLGCMALAAVLVLALHSVAAACPTCGEAVGNHDPTHGGMAKGYFYSILFMMGAPFTILGVFCGCMYYKVRRIRSQGQTGPKRPLAGSAAALPPNHLQGAREPVEV
jgi:hypothetical protein